MPDFECEIGDFCVRVRYDTVEDKLVWNAVLFRAGTPIHSLAGTNAHVPKTSPVTLIQDAITTALRSSDSMSIVSRT
jgi:hypothetical protein